LGFLMLPSNLPLARPAMSWASSLATADQEEEQAGVVLQRTVAYIGAPFCEGQNLVGTDLAPTALREAGLQAALARIGWDWEDQGDIDFKAHFRELRGAGGEATVEYQHTIQLYREWVSSGMAENFSTWVSRKRKRKRAAQGGAEEGVLSTHTPGQVDNSAMIGSGLRLVYDAVDMAARGGSFVLTVGGDHSIASASIAALHRTYPDLAVIWIDAHADANTPETSPSGHYHGMPAAHLMGWFDQEKPVDGFEWFPHKGCLSESRLAYVGLRDIDAQEGKLLRRSSVHCFTMREVDKHGIAKVIESALQAVDPNGRRPLHLSLDIDGIDPHFAPGTGTCARGGLSYREIHYICEELALTRRLVSMDLVEVNPALDAPPPSGPMHGDDPTIKASPQTVRLAAELVLSALGKTILPA